MKKLLILMLLLQGCAVQKQLVPTGGSRADGTVKLAFDYGLFEDPKLDQQQGLIAARQRCAAWGYSDAASFGGSTSQCTAPTRNGCNRWLVTIEYQCTGTPPSSK